MSIEFYKTMKTETSAKRILHADCWG